eukprot:scaffold292621_cov37-Prasinocladus_malaysianus.AAC.1
MHLQDRLILALRDACRGPDNHVELSPDGGPHMERQDHEDDRWPSQPRLTGLAPHKPQKDKPLHVVELRAGIATGLEAPLRHGYTI